MPVYSHSRLACFEQCSLKFKYKYIDKLKAETEQTIEAFLGSRVHEALEKLYQDHKFQKKTTLEEILAYFKSEWEKQCTDEIVIVRKDFSKENYYDMGVRFITEYYNKNTPFNQTKTLGIETLVNIDINGDGKYKLRGYIDRLACNGDDFFEIHDYKTGAHLPAQDYHNSDRQLALYAIAIKKMYPQAKKIDLVWHFLAFNQEMRSRRTDEELEALKKEIAERIDTIESAKEFEAKESALCNWCEFGPICPKKKHLYEVNALTPEAYKKEDGVRLVNEYYGLNEKKTSAERELSDARAKLFDYAKQQNLENIAGSDVIAKLKIYPNVSFPSRTDLDRGEVEMIIRKAGLWTEFSQLDTFLLSRKMRAGQVDPDIIRKIKPFVTLSETKRVYMNKKSKWD
ncbi:MAG: PD-(D/E)XK nuclease family protein [Candidatus Aenigmarchaeota archaeon]|nr:PD-(D/E)XK nuclease family protein [Candidatus Aenigmarchaeota archaeon]